MRIETGTDEARDYTFAEVLEIETAKAASRGGPPPSLPPDVAGSYDPDEGSDSWCTPRDLAMELGHWDLDPCSNARSHVSSHVAFALSHDTTDRPDLHPVFFAGDGIERPWDGSVFVNPPYSNPLPWCVRLAAHGAPWAALLKLDTTTRWWSVLMHSGASWAPFRKRLKFESGKKALTANFASVLVWRDWTPPRAVAARLWLPTYGVIS